MKSTLPSSSPKCDIDGNTNAPATRAVQNEILEHLKKISDNDVEKLKEHVRILKGLTLTKEKTKKNLDFLGPPVVTPRSNTAADLRTKIQHRWLELNLKSLMKKYSLTEKDVDEKLYRTLRKEALTRSCSEYSDEKEIESSEDLKKLSILMKHHEESTYRTNRNYDFRLRTIKGMPIITEHFKAWYEDYQKSPFVLSRKLIEPRVCQMPAINEDEEIWLFPFAREDLVPLHWLKKTEPVDTRSSREKARPPLKPGKRTPLAERRSIKPKPTKKPPWHYTSSCSNFNAFNIV